MQPEGCHRRGTQKASRRESNAEGVGRGGDAEGDEGQTQKCVKGH